MAWFFVEAGVIKTPAHKGDRPYEQTVTRLFILRRRLDIGLIERSAVRELKTKTRRATVKQIARTIQAKSNIMVLFCIPSSKKNAHSARTDIRIPGATANNMTIRGHYGQVS